MSYQELFAHIQYTYKIILVDSCASVRMSLIPISKMILVSQRTDCKSKICNTLT